MLSILTNQFHIFIALERGLTIFLKNSAIVINIKRKNLISCENWSWNYGIFDTSCIP